jgi:hypothetical protein
MRATQHFHRGLLLTTTQQKKIISEKHTKIFLEFFIFLKKQNNKEEKQKREKLFTRESSQQVKEEMRNLFGFSFTTTKLQLIKLERKTKKKREIFLNFLKFFKHTRRK